MTGFSRKPLVHSALYSLAISLAPSVSAQDLDNAPAQMESGSSSEIVVTARKRQESILKVPVVMTAIGSDKLENLQVNNLEDLPKLVPGLNLGHTQLAIGTQVSIRGVGTSSLDPSIDQSISLTIDGLSLGQGLAFSSGLFDLQQVEVLKGPQALFFGKSSPAGVISLRTADPTDRVELIARAGYEFEADEARGELILSGPLTDTLKGRVAGLYSASKGYFRNDAVAVPGTGALDPKYDRASRSHSYVVRGTLLWEPSSDLSARFKVNLVRDRATNSETFQLVSCPQGTAPAPGGVNPFVPDDISFISGDDCRMNRSLRSVDLDPNVFEGIANNGVPYVLNMQKFGTLELNYDITPALSLNSTTGYYHLRHRSMVNPTKTTAIGPQLGVENRFGRRQFTQELRLNSDFDGPLNFTLGGFFEDGRIYDRVPLRGNTAYGLPPLLGDGEATVDIKTYSLFGQLRWKITPQLELAGGARWTDETRTQEAFSLTTGSPLEIPVVVPRISGQDVVPEVTLTYTPTDDLTIFGAYKQGRKSGSFSIATTPRPGMDNSFGDEKVEGGEIGLKARIAGRRLLVNLSAYDYRYSGLQVGGTERPDIPNAPPIIRTVNSGKARTYGIDLDAAWRPAGIDGLSVNAAINWNRGRYKVLNNIPCYNGQTIGDGCNQFLNPVTGLYTAQDLSGTPLVRAPEWQATFGFDYELPLGSGYTMVVSNNNQYSSRFVTALAINRPAQDNYQDSFVKSDISLTLRGPDDRWELAAIGKNITDKLTASTCAPSNYRNGNVVPQITGGATRGVAGLSEMGCFVERGRSVWLRLTLRPFN